MLNRALFSSVKDDWPTPWEFFHNLDLEFDFTLDVCAVPWSAKVWRYCVPPHALRVWGETTFRFPARTDTAWFHEHVCRAATEIRFLKGRLKFEGAAASAPFPSMIAVWGKV